MKRRVLSVLLCAGLVVSVLAGCGSDDAKKDSGKRKQLQKAISIM